MFLKAQLLIGQVPGSSGWPGEDLGAGGHCCLVERHQSLPHARLKPGHQVHHVGDENHAGAYKLQINLLRYELLKRRYTSLTQKAIGGVAAFWLGEILLFLGSVI